MNIKDKITAELSAFPTLPAISQKLISMLYDPNAKAEEICNVIQYDPALTANILKAANSAILGFNRSASSINEAMTRIGSQWVLQLAMSSLIYTNVNAPAPGYELQAEDLWRHSIAVAMMSENICSIIGGNCSGIAFTAGLLHDMGKIMIESYISDYYNKILKNVEENHISFVESEREVLGIDHSEAGALIAEYWSFPNSIINIIKWHHNPENAPEQSEVLDIVHVADAICIMQGYGIGRDGLQYKCNENSISRLALKTSTIEKATSQLAASFEDVEQMFLKSNKTAVARR